MLGIGTILSAVFGSITGITGHWFKAKEEKDKREHEREMISLNMERDKLDSELRIKEIDANVRVEESRLEGELLIEEGKGFNEAVVDATKNKLSVTTLNYLLNGNWFKQFFGIQIAYLLGLTDVIRGIIRPLLTASAFVAIGYLAYVLSGGFTKLSLEQQTLIVGSLIDALIYVLTASTQFWYMDRHGARDFRKKH